MTAPVYLLSCLPEHIDGDGACTQPVWVEKPVPVLPALTLEEGVEIAFAIIGVWVVGLACRLYIRATQQGRY
ncbi:hypothetical protein FKV24_008045 [Lysobacter maris]|uniref:Uncharacterized protein n=1 Tax=Marilutibacter maris TaxID=1605891 RepID=A0A508ARX1_9GAMM|nr:hypothetical protein [Lysobacter maris]KAB8191350.1 hypothetical protein FKV24_008045 [Lysobacter maris]